MERKLKVREFFGKHKLLDHVNSNADKLEIVSISSSQARERIHTES